MLSELMAHKRIEVAVRAFNELRLPLVVVGNGPDARRLHRLAGPTVSFTGRVSDAEAARSWRAARALVVTATEEFGIAAVEAQAAGRPVIALREGGVRETVSRARPGLLRHARARRAGRGRAGLRRAGRRPRRLRGQRPALRHRRISAAACAPSSSSRSTGWVRAAPRAAGRPRRARGLARAV